MSVERKALQKWEMVPRDHERRAHDTLDATLMSCWRDEVWRRDGDGSGREGHCRRCNRWLTRDSFANRESRGECHHVSGRGAAVRHDVRNGMLLCPECHALVTGIVGRRVFIRCRDTFVAGKDGQTYLDASGQADFHDTREAAEQPWGEKEQQMAEKTKKAPQADEADVAAVQAAMEANLAIMKVAPIFHVSEQGIALEPGTKPTREQGEELAACIGKVLRAGMYWAGDAANLLEEVFGEEASQFLDAEHFGDVGVLSQAQQVCKKVGPGQRAKAKSFGHSKAVAGLKVKDQDKYLQLALDNDWSPSKLKAEVDGIGASAETGLKFILVVDCGTEARQGEVKADLEKQGLAVTVRTSVKKAAKPAKPKKEVTAKKKRTGPPKMYARRRVPK